MNEETEEVITHKKMIEVLAWTLFQRLANFDHLSLENPIDKLGAWQREPNTRSNWRSHALELVGELNESGLRVAVGSQRKIDAEVNALAVVPASSAYDFNAD